MLSDLARRRARFDDSEAAHDMDKLSAERAKLRAEFITAREAGDQERERELVVRSRNIDREYEAAADRRRAARRQLTTIREERRA